jgi:hypothetical protein
MASEIKLTTMSLVEGRKIKEVLERQEISSKDISLVEKKLARKVAKLSEKIEWVVDVQYYQRPNGKFLLSGTPVILED